LVLQFSKIPEKNWSAELPPRVYTMQSRPTKLMVTCSSIPAWETEMEIAVEDRTGVKIAMPVVDALRRAILDNRIVS
jgi:hypothetical protein